MHHLDLDQIVPLGLVALFGGLVLWLPIGALVARRKGFLAGMGTGMLLFGLTGASVAVLLAWHVYLDTAVAELPQVDCQVVPPTPDMSVQRDRWRRVAELERDGQHWRLAGAPEGSDCRRGGPKTLRLRYHPAALQPGVAEVRARLEPDATQAPAMIGVFGAFGGFGLLGGGVISLFAAGERRAAQGIAEPPPRPVPAWRRRLSGAFILSGNLAVFGSAVIAGFFDDRLALPWRGSELVFRSVGIACACWAVAAALRGSLTLMLALFLLLLGGGFWLAGASLGLIL